MAAWLDSGCQSPGKRGKNMHELYYFEDGEGIPLDVEEDLNELVCNLKVIRLLYDLACADGLEDYIVYQLFCSISTARELSEGLVLGFHKCKQDLENC